MATFPYSQLRIDTPFQEVDFHSYSLQQPGEDNFYRLTCRLYHKRELGFSILDASGTRQYIFTRNWQMDVIVRPRHLLEFRLTPDACTGISEFCFDVDADDNRQWAYEQDGQIAFPQGIEETAWAALNTRMRADLGDTFSPLEAYHYIPNQTALQRNPNYTLRLPYTPFHLLRTILDEQQLPYEVRREPQEQPRPVILFINDESYLLARDFEVDIPDALYTPTPYPEASDII
ncbi:hypothetical protein A0257_02720 [Hymenobacter psoromatis]|nr:hypothetical protein A0257_02720 [Hymenobacter psoromatis]